MNGDDVERAEPGTVEAVAQGIIDYFGDYDHWRGNTKVISERIREYVHVETTAAIRRTEAKFRKEFATALKQLGDYRRKVIGQRACMAVMQRAAEANCEKWKCVARHGIATDPPQDCDWPMCGCDPRANKVLEALQEADCGRAETDVPGQPYCSPLPIEPGGRLCSIEGCGLAPEAHHPPGRNVLVLDLPSNKRTVVILNGHALTVEGEQITYEAICMMAGRLTKNTPRAGVWREPRNLSVTFDVRRSTYSCTLPGILLPGQSLQLMPGLVINAYDTSNA